ncbi:hypothetical protein TSMEX_009763 [Taenia solium]|eukprot:TsM_000128700 transcript=TsM_000128700 gene=TsM_000128700
MLRKGWRWHDDEIDGTHKGNTWEKSHCHKRRTPRLQRFAGHVQPDFRFALLNMRPAIDYFSAVCVCVRVACRRWCLPNPLRNHPDGSTSIPEARGQYIPHHCLTHSCLYDVGHLLCLQYYRSSLD